MLRYHWGHMGYLEETIEELEKQIDHPLSPDRKEVELLDGIPGVNKAAAAKPSSQLQRSCSKINCIIM